MKFPLEKFAVAILLASLYLPALAGAATSDGMERAPNFSFYNLPGADESAAASTLAASDHYRFVAGSAFTARTSSQTVTYGGTGCITSDAAVTTDLQLPEDTTIHGIRLYYYNMGQPGDVTLFLTTYDGAGNFNDLLVESSTLDSGYASDYFAFSSPISIDNYAYAYVLTATTSPNTKVCGARVYLDLP